MKFLKSATIAIALTLPTVALASHDRDEQMVSFKFGCFHQEVITEIIHAPSKLDKNMAAHRATHLNLCFYNDDFWIGAFEEIVLDTKWGSADREQVLILKTHDKNGTLLFTYFTGDRAALLKVFPHLTLQKGASI